MTCRKTRKLLLEMKVHDLTNEQEPTRSNVSNISILLKTALKNLTQKLTLTNYSHQTLQYNFFSRNLNFLPNLKSNFSNTLILFELFTNSIVLVKLYFCKI